MTIDELEQIIAIMATESDECPMCVGNMLDALIKKFPLLTMEEMRGIAIKAAGYDTWN